MACIFINVGGYFINTRQPCSVFAQQVLSEPKLKKKMYNNVENSKTYHFQLNSLKNTQCLGLGKTGLKTQKLSFCQFNSWQMKHNFKKLKEFFVKNISIFNPMVLVSTYDNCTECGMHFPKPSFEYLRNLEFQSFFFNLSKILPILVIHVQFKCYAFLACIFMLMASIFYQVSITVKKRLILQLS